MKSNPITALTFSLLVVLAPALAKADTVIDVGRILFNTALTPKEKAEQLARGAELLNGAMDADYAERVLQYALQLDPTNLRAQLVQREAALTHMMYEFGARSRWIGSQLKGPMKRDYDESMQSILSYPKFARQYRAQNAEAFRKGADVRDFAKRLLRKVDENIAFISRNQDKTIDIQTFDGGFQFTADESTGQACPTREPSPNVFVIESCAGQTLEVVRIDKHDWQAMKFDLMRQKFNLMLGLAYSQDELPEILIKISSLAPEKMTLKNLGAIIQKSARFGRLVDRQSLKQLRSVGADGSFLVREMVSGFKCVDGRVPETRDGHKYRLGVCSDLEFPFLSGRFEEKARAPFKTIVKVVKDYALDPANDESIPYETEMDIRPALSGEIVSLKALIPNSYDKCGKPMSFADPTLNRSLPRGDLLTVVSSYRTLREKLSGEDMQCRP